MLRHPLVRGGGIFSSSRSSVARMCAFAVNANGTDDVVGFDILSAHKTQAVRDLLEQNPRVRFHFSPLIVPGSIRSKSRSRRSSAM